MSHEPAMEPLAGATIGINQILWANDDLPELTPPIDPLTILDEMARLGYIGSQLGTTFPRGDELLSALRSRGLLISEVYAGLPCTVDGPTGTARDVGRQKLAELHAAEGDVLVAALPLSPRSRPAPPFRQGAPPERVPWPDSACRRYRDRSGPTSSGSPDILRYRRHTR